MSEFAPMDILGKKFTKKLHGYAELEVHEYLTDLARVVEGLLRERGELKQRVHHMEQELSAFRERESALKEALVGALDDHDLAVGERTNASGSRAFRKLLELAAADAAGLAMVNTQILVADDDNGMYVFNECGGEFGVVLTRREGEAIILETSDGPIRITLAEYNGSQTKVGIDAPQSVRVLREELVGDSQPG